MTGSSRKPGGPLRRLGRLLLGKNELRRPAARIEAALIVTLAAAFLIAAIAAIRFAGHLYQTQHTAAARLRPAVAVLTQHGPVGVGAATTATAGGRWRLPDGTGRTG